MWKTFYEARKDLTKMNRYSLEKNPENIRFNFFQIPKKICLGK